MSQHLLVAAAGAAVALLLTIGIPLRVHFGDYDLVAPVSYVVAALVGALSAVLIRHAVRVQFGR